MPGTLPKALAAGALSGLMVAMINFAGPIAMPFVIVAPLPTFVVALSKGLAPGLYALGAATLVTAVAVNLDLALKYAVVFAAPQAWLIRQALLKRETPKGPEWYPPGLLIAWLVAIAAAYVAAATLAYAGSEGGLAGAMRHDVEQVLKLMAAVHGWPSREQDIEVLAPALASIMPALLANLWLLMMVANGAMAQALVARGRNLRPSTPFAELETPAVLIYALGAALVLSLLPGELGFLGRTLITIIMAAYFVFGLAVLHWIARRITARRAFLFTVYFLIVLLQWLAIAVLILGLSEQVFGLRKRFFSANKGQEDE
jgi:hypothetical protein